MDVDKKIINMINHVTPEERNALMKMLDLNRTSPEMKVVLAIFRDIYIFKEMSQAMLMRYTGKIRELESRIEELENAKARTQGGQK